jgi:putative transposase
LPVLYLRGVSTGDFQEALAALLGKDAPNLSPAVITRLTAEWQADYDAWQKRDLSARRYVYVWADGVYLQARMESTSTRRGRSLTISRIECASSNWRCTRTKPG